MTNADLHANEMDMFAYFYIKNSIQAKYLILQVMEDLQHFPRMNDILILRLPMLWTPSCMNASSKTVEECLGPFQKLLEILS